MKKFWRCFVCNDIHYGVKALEICPTCLVKNAYVEISSSEAGQISRPTQTSLDGNDFLRAIQAFAEKNADLMRSYRPVIAPKCGGQLRTPTFFNTETNDVLCGEVEYEKLKEWALK